LRRCSTDAAPERHGDASKALRLSEIAIAAGAAVLAWWASTIVVMYLDGLPRRTHRWSLTVATLVAIVGIGVALWSSRHTTVASAYLAVGSAIAIWGWHELAFLTGTLTGSRRFASDARARGWRRVWQATETILHHEIALAATATALALATWQHPNRYGLWTFLALWAMRLSAKLNLFLGARNLGLEFLPAHLQYLGTYMTRRRMNALFPFSVLLGCGAIALTIQSAYTLPASSHTVVGRTLLSTLLALGVLEHLFLMTPAPPQALWSWGLRSHPRQAVRIANIRSS
jgi:putative photosynthetic complex assembly protein 2